MTEDGTGSKWFKNVETALVDPGHTGLMRLDLGEIKSGRVVVGEHVIPVAEILNAIPATSHLLISREGHVHVNVPRDPELTR